jgi:hypothetical protein
MTLLTDTLAPDATYSPARPRHGTWASPAIIGVVLAAVGLLLGALVGALIGLAASILLAGPDATLLMVLGGAGEGTFAGVVIGIFVAIRVF